MGDKYVNPTNPSGFAGHARMLERGFIVAVCSYCHEKRWYTRDELALGNPMCRTCATSGIPSKPCQDGGIPSRGGLTVRQRTKKH
jgi:hypothetical protein